MLLVSCFLVGVSTVASTSRKAKPQKVDERKALTADAGTVCYNYIVVRCLISIHASLSQIGTFTLTIQTLEKRKQCRQFIYMCSNDVTRDVAAAPQTPQLGGPRPTLGAQVSLKLLFGYVTIFSSADLFTTDLNCRKKLACDIISEC